jgi:hypothetical protein
MPPDTMWPHRRKSLSMNDGSGKRVEFLAVLNRPELRTGNADTSRSSVDLAPAQDDRASA